MTIEQEHAAWLENTIANLERIAKEEHENALIAQSQRNGIISRLRLRWPHIQIAVRGRRCDPGPPGCLRCSIEDEIGEPFHDGLGPPRGGAKMKEQAMVVLSRRVSFRELELAKFDLAKQMVDDVETGVDSVRLVVLLWSRDRPVMGLEPGELLMQFSDEPPAVPWMDR